jgi:pimeloyl-ACP methyl ester carboxylesterase
MRCSYLPVDPPELSGRARPSRPLAARLTRRVLVLMVALAGAWSAIGAGVASASTPICRSMQVPVTVPGVSNASLYGQLCEPAGARPRAVQLLVHGLLDNHYYFDLPYQPQTYSYVLHAVNDGYATFNIDRLGVGQSSHPPSANVTNQASVDTLHQVVTDLRSGAIGGRPFSRVVFFGHSFGVVYAWLYASEYRDISAYILTGTLHVLSPSFVPAIMDALYPAADDPKFANQPWAIGDSGYVTTQPGTRPSLFFYAPNTDPKVLELDESLVKDTFSLTEIANIANLLSSPAPPPSSAPSRFITVPTLVVVGQDDVQNCGPDALDCTTANVVQQEAPYYPNASLTVHVVPNAGHDVQLEPNAPITDARMLNWLDSALH